MTCCPVVVFSCFLQIVKTVGKAIKMNAILNFTYNQFKYQGIEKSKKYILKDNFFCYIPSPAIRKEQQSYVFKYTNQSSLSKHEWAAHCILSRRLNFRLFNILGSVWILNCEGGDKEKKLG